MYLHLSLPCTPFAFSPQFAKPSQLQDSSPRHPFPPDVFRPVFLPSAPTTASRRRHRDEVKYDIEVIFIIEVSPRHHSGLESVNKSCASARWGCRCRWRRPGSGLEGVARIWFGNWWVWRKSFSKAAPSPSTSGPAHGWRQRFSFDGVGGTAGLFPAPGIERRYVFCLCSLSVPKLMPR